MVDLGSIDCVGLFKSYGGTNSTGRLRIYQLNPITNEPSNPYELPDTSPNTPFLVLDIECTSIKDPFARQSKREQVGNKDNSLWRVTISGAIEPEKLKLKNYVIVNWAKQRIQGVLDNVTRKHSHRYHLSINTAENVPFLIPE